MDNIDIETATILQVEIMEMTENEIKQLNESDMALYPDDNTILLDETEELDEEGMVYTDDSLMLQEDILADPVDEADVDESLEVKSPENVEVISESQKDSFDEHSSSRESFASPNSIEIKESNSTTFNNKSFKENNIAIAGHKVTFDKREENHGLNSEDEADSKDKKCRVCLAQMDLTYIFNFDDSGTIAQKIMTICSRVRIRKNDSLPQFICTKCLQSVNVAFHFKALCEATDKELKEELSIQRAKARRSVRYTVDIDSDFSEPDATEKTEDDDFKVSEVSQESDIDFDSDSDFDGSKRRSKRVRRKAASRKRQSKKSNANTSKISKSSNHIDENNYMGQSSGSEQSPKRKKQDNDSGLCCNLCNRKFATKKSLARHKRAHSDQQFVCEYCNRSFKHFGSYQTHISKHENEEGLKCQLCNKVFVSRGEQQKHMIEIHNDHGMTINCDKCKRIFKTQVRLDKHKESKCPGFEASHRKRSEIENLTLGKDLFKCVAPLTTTYWSDSFSD